MRTITKLNPAFKLTQILPWWPDLSVAVAGGDRRGAARLAVRNEAIAGRLPPGLMKGCPNRQADAARVMN